MIRMLMLLAMAIAGATQAVWRGCSRAYIDITLRTA